MVLMIKGEAEKANKIFQTALEENNVFELPEGDQMLSANNHDLSSIIFNYIKCNLVHNMHNYMVLDTYR